MRARLASSTSRRLLNEAVAIEIVGQVRDYGRADGGHLSVAGNDRERPGHDLHPDIAVHLAPLLFASVNVDQATRGRVDVEVRKTVQCEQRVVVVGFDTEIIPGTMAGRSSPWLCLEQIAWRVRARAAQFHGRPHFLRPGVAVRPLLF